MKVNVKVNDIFNEQVKEIKNLDKLIKFYEKEVMNYQSIDRDYYFHASKIKHLNYFQNVDEKTLNKLIEFINYIESKKLDTYDKINTISTYGAIVKYYHTEVDLKYDINKTTLEEMYFLASIMKRVAYSDYLLFCHIFLNPLIMKYIFSSNRDVEILIKDYFKFQGNDGLSISGFINDYCMDMGIYIENNDIKNITKEVISRYKEYLATEYVIEEPVMKV